MSIRGRLAQLTNRGLGSGESIVGESPLTLRPLAPLRRSIASKEKSPRPWLPKSLGDNTASVSEVELPNPQ
jgi:hypothetical protein